MWNEPITLWKLALIMVVYEVLVGIVEGWLVRRKRGGT